MPQNLPRVLLTNVAPSEHFAALSEWTQLEFASDPFKLMPYEEAIRRIPGCVALINQGELRVDAALLDAAPGLKIVANVSIGFDNLQLAELTRRGIWATNAPNAFTETTADCALALLLAVTRKIVIGDRYVRSGQWPKDGLQPARWEGRLLSGQTLGIVGYGKIGQAVARRAQAFGMRIIYHRANPDGGEGCRDLESLLREADVVSLHTPLTPKTERMINERTLAMMKPGSYLINLARGRVVDESALVEALRSGHLAGAGLDVFEREPEVNPALWELPNVVLAPHVGGATLEARRSARLLAAENVALVLRGGRPQNSLNTLPG